MKTEWIVISASGFSTRHRYLDASDRTPEPWDTAYPQYAPHTVVERQVAKRAEQQTRLAGYVGQWSGAYVCRGQSVALRLVVEALAEDGTLSGRFEFSPLDGDRRTPSGSFAFAMTEDLETRVLTAKATDWINRPANYKMLDFTAEVRDQTRMVGKPSGSCTSLTVRKF